MTTHPARLRRVAQIRARDLQRGLHLITAATVLAYVYLGQWIGGDFTLAVRWVLTPVLVGSGLALWKWHRVRRALRRIGRP